MFKNYLKIALRNLRNHKIYSFINISGLAVGIACCVLMLLYVQDELTFDHFHDKSERIYRLVETRPSPEGVQSLGYTIGPAGQALVNDFPEIVKSVRIRDRIGVGRFVLKQEENRFLEAHYLVTEPSFFEMFDFTLQRGNAATALAEPNTIVLTPDAVKKYFGDQDPINGIIASERWGDLRVTGVVSPPPTNSHVNFDMLISLATLEAIPDWKEFIDSWSSTGFAVYVLANRSLDLHKFNSALPRFVATYRTNQETQRDLALQPLHDIHFGSSQFQFQHNARQGVLAYVYIFSAIALFILAIACINYMNLATARFARRAREIGLRKVVGAQRWQVAGQILSESVLSTVISLLLALALVQIVLPAFNNLADKQLVLELSSNAFMAFSLFGLVLIVGVISGSYPALYLSGLRPSGLFKNTKGRNDAASVLRRILVVSQFALSVIMMISTVVAFQQLDYVRSKNLGFNYEQLVVVDINSGGVRRSFEAIKAEMAKIPSVKSVSVSSRVPGEWKDIAQVEARAADRPDRPALSAFFFAIDQDFITTFEMELLAGRNISSAMGTDTSAVIINETAAKALGLSDPIGQEIFLGTVGERGSYRARVVGMVRDFHFQSLHEVINPLVLGHWNNPIRVIDYFTCRVSTDNLAETIADLKSVHERFDQTVPFEYNFLDDRLKDFYETDTRVGRIFSITASLAMVIACLGLFGLAAFTTEQRTKEIGVRKVLGASSASLVTLISQDFVKLVIIANVVAWPVAWYAMNRWLDDFAYHVEIRWTVFAIAGAMALLVTLVTVSSHAFKAAVANPVDSLRYE